MGAVFFWEGQENRMKIHLPAEFWSILWCTGATAPFSHQMGACFAKCWDLRSVAK